MDSETAFDQFFLTRSLTNLHCWAQPRSLLQKGLETVTGVPGFAVGPSLNGLKWSEWGPLRRSPSWTCLTTLNSTLPYTERGLWLCVPHGMLGVRSLTPSKPSTRGSPGTAAPWAGLMQEASVLLQSWPHPASWKTALECRRGSGRAGEEVD